MTNPEPVDVETFARALHEAMREAAREGRRVMARKVLARFNVAER